MKRFVFAPALALLVAAPVVHAMTGEVSFTPTGLRLSVMRITIGVDHDGSVGSEQVLYTCPHATEEECLVDVTDQSSLDAIAALTTGARIQTGSYDRLSIDLCAPGKNGMTPAPGYVKGTFHVESESKTYATREDGGVGEVADENDAGPEFAAIGNWSCNTKTVVLADPVSVTEGGSTPLTVVVDADLIAFSTSNTSPGMGGCRGGVNGNARGLCVSYPSLFPIIGETQPHLDRYLVSHHRDDVTLVDDSLANAYVVVASGGPADRPVTAFVRPYFSETSAHAESHTTLDAVTGGPGYFGETIVSSFHVNPDGSVAFSTGGSLDDNAAVFSNFVLGSHYGIVQSHAGDSWHYHAFPILPTP